MPEYLAPGVYVEETSFRSKSIEGVSTTTTGFVGPTRYGPVDLEPDIITSLGEFERCYGDRYQMRFSPDDETHNYMWHATRAFFEEGGRRLYVSRVYRANMKPDGDGVPPYKRPDDDLEKDRKISPEDGVYPDGHAREWLINGMAGIPSEANVGSAVQLRSRFPGLYGNFKVRFKLKGGPNILSGDSEGIASLSGSLQEHDVVWIGDETYPIESPPGLGQFYIAKKDRTWGGWCFEDKSGPQTSPPGIGKLIPVVNLNAGHAVHIVTASVTVLDVKGEEIGTWADFPLDPEHARAGQKDSLFDYFGVAAPSMQLARQLPIVILAGNSIRSGLDVLRAIFKSEMDSLPTFTSPPDRLTLTRGQHLLKGIDTKEIRLLGGNDGLRPESSEYEGKDDPQELYKTGLKQFEDIEDISIVAAPGSTGGYLSRKLEAQTIMNRLIGHAERMRYRIAVLDSGDGLSISEVRDLRGKLDSKHAALYYPWVRVLDPVTRKEINLPPSGFVAGIYARNDINRAVYKAPANEVVNLAIGFETLLNKSQQEVLNPEGINCFRYFEGRGYRLWGARTISSDPEWKYVNIRRYFAYIERSIDKGTQWAVFEPNGEALWANVRRTIEDFLFNEYQMGALLGDKPEKAYFVRCDRSTMTQNDLDNGRLVCLIGVAPLRPAEFVIFRIGQWTSDRKS